MQFQRIARDTRKSGIIELYERIKNKKEFRKMIKKLVRKEMQSYTLIKRQENWIMKYMEGRK